MACGLTPTERELLDHLQSGFPVEEKPYRRLADNLGLTAQDALSLTRELYRRGVIRRLGPVYDARSLGYVSTLLAIEVADRDFDEVAHRINAFPEVTHNYRRDHRFNCWCALLAVSEERLREVVASAARIPGVVQALELPVRRRYKLRLAFPLSGTDGVDDVG